MIKIAKISSSVLIWRKKFLEFNNWRRLCVLGIETSCDDTGIAIVEHVNNYNKVLANTIYSQQCFHNRYGGIMPPRAQDLHRKNISRVFEQCLEKSKIKVDQIDAVAVTTRPGLQLSLTVGLRFARFIARLYNKPILPVHHMEAHALQVRMEYDIPYPFLCLLISGGHCQLTFVRNCNDFLLLGESLDDAPGETFDKIARRLRMTLIPMYSNCNGGQIIEKAARLAKNTIAFDFPIPLSRIRDCNFSFAGIKNKAFRTIYDFEVAFGTRPDSIINHYGDFCSGILYTISRHLMNRTQRALEYCILKNNYFEKQARSLVIAGGVANNDIIYDDLTHLAHQYDCNIYRPSQSYCSDNGVMIAWNGIEQMLFMGKKCMRWDYENVVVKSKASLGRSIIAKVAESNIKCKRLQMIEKKLK